MGGLCGLKLKRVRADGRRVHALPAAYVPSSRPLQRLVRGTKQWLHRLGARVVAYPRAGTAPGAQIGCIPSQYALWDRVQVPTTGLLDPSTGGNASRRAIGVFRGTACDLHVVWVSSQAHHCSALR